MSNTPAKAINRPPWGLKWRSSVSFVTIVVGFGIITDVFSYAIIIPVIPFHLQALGYNDPSTHTGWILFAYSAALAISTFPIAYLSERYESRHSPLLGGLFVLISSQLLFLFAPFYWLMVLARALQGTSSTIIWTLGLALLCDTTPTTRVGQQLGLALMGLSVGFVLAPPLGGALYQRFGFKAPMLFSVAITSVDLVGRILVIERKAAMRWGLDPARILVREDTVLSAKSSRRFVGEGIPDNLHTSHTNSVSEERGKNNGNIQQRDDCVLASDSSTHTGAASSRNAGAHGTVTISPTPKLSPKVSLHPVMKPTDNYYNSQKEINRNSGYSMKIDSHLEPENPPVLTSLQVLFAICRSRRACAAFANTLIFGITASAQEPTLSLRLQHSYGMTPGQVGLVYIASSIPSLAAAPLAGWLSDRKGIALITLLCPILSIPWFLVMAVQGPLALIIICVVMTTFFKSSSVAPLSAELAAVRQVLPGVGYSHLYGVFNLAFGIGAAIGPLIGGQIYDHAWHGWTVIVGLAAGLMVVATLVVFFSTDEVPFARRIRFS